MHVVTCPNCNQTLDVGREVHNARVRCRGCGHAFTATTRVVEAPAPAAPPPAPGGGPTPYYGARPARRRRPAYLVPALVVGGLLLATVVVVILLSYYATHPKLIVRHPQTGEVLWTGRVSEEDLERKRRQILARAEALPPEPAPPEPAPARRPAAEPAGAAPRPDPIQPGEAFASGAIGEPITRGDDRVRVTGLEPVPGPTNDFGAIAAQLRNLTDVPLRSVEVTLTLVNEAGRHRPLPAVRVAYVPPQGTVHFSAPYDGLAAEQIAACRAEVAAVQPDPNLAVVAIPPTDVRVDYRASSVRVHGRARNISPWTVEQPQVVCGLLDSEGVLEATVTAPAVGEGGGPIAPGQAFRFEMEHETAVPALLQRFEPRLVGRRGR